MARFNAEYPDVYALTHFDHGEFDDDADQFAGDLSGRSSVMFDASAVPVEINLARSAEFVAVYADGPLVEAVEQILDARPRHDFGFVANHLDGQLTPFRKLGGIGSQAARQADRIQPRRNRRFAVKCTVSPGQAYCEDSRRRYIASKTTSALRRAMTPLSASKGEKS